MAVSKVSTNAFLTATVINNLKKEIDAELTRRGGEGSLYGYGTNSSYDFTATASGKVVVDNYNDSIGLINIIKAGTPKTVSIDSKTLVADFNTAVDQLAEATAITNKQSTSHGCNASCTGLCSSKCYGSCKGACSATCAHDCASSCVSGCKGGASGSKSTSSTAGSTTSSTTANVVGSTTSSTTADVTGTLTSSSTSSTCGTCGSGCTGTCYGCSGCSGCSGTCDSACKGCNGCSGSCSGSCTNCTTTCKNAKQNPLCNDCIGQC